MTRVLITGAAGDIGRRLRGLLPRHYASLRLSDRVVPTDLRADEEFVPAELADLGAVERIVAGVDAIIHLGGISVENSWEAILPTNIVGTYNLFEAARRAGVSRVIFASSFHVIGYYRRARRLTVDALVRPDSRYGVSKAYGEALAALYADKYAMKVLCIRIGNVADHPVDKRRLSNWLSPDDLLQLVRIGLEHPDLAYEVVWGMSDNERAWWDNTPAFRLGYRPTGRAEDLVHLAMAGEARLPPDPIGDQFQGGPFCAREFVSDAARIKA